MRLTSLLWTGALTAVVSSFAVTLTETANAQIYTPGSADSDLLCKRDRADRRNKVNEFLRLRWAVKCGVITQEQFAAFAPTAEAIRAKIMATNIETMMTPTIDVASLPDFAPGSPVYNETWSYPVILHQSELAKARTADMIPVGTVANPSDPDGLKSIVDLTSVQFKINDDGDALVETAACGTLAERRKLKFAAQCTDAALAPEVQLNHAVAESLGRDLIRSRCRNDDAVWTEIWFARRLNWGRQCGLLTAEDYENALYTRNGSGRTPLPPTERKFPTFAHYPADADSIARNRPDILLQKFPLWAPESMPVTPGASDYLPTEIVRDVSENPWEKRPDGTHNEYDIKVLKPNDTTGNFDDCRRPADVFLFSMCEYGCFAPEQKLLFSSGETAIESAIAQRKLDLVTLAPNATFDSLTYVGNEVGAYTADVAAQRQELVEIRMESGRVLRVTTGHPLIAEDGTIRLAREFQLGDRLIRKDGGFDAIVGFNSVDYVGKVYNVKPVTTDATSNVVVAEGYLSASQRYQTPVVQYLNRKIIRRSVPDWALER